MLFNTAVTAPTRARWDRLVARGRTGDSATFDEFIANETLELAHPDPEGQQGEFADIRCVRNLELRSTLTLKHA
jgi:hypothetical protein